MGMTREEAIEFIAQSVKSDVDMAKVADAIEALNQGSVIESAYKTGYKLGRLAGMSDSVREKE